MLLCTVKRGKRLRLNALGRIHQHEHALTSDKAFFNFV